MVKRQRKAKTTKKVKTKKVKASEEPAPIVITPRLWGSYIWATWINSLLADDEQCQYQAWFRAHFKYPRVEPDLEKWKREHGEGVRVRALELAGQGFKVRTEDQNAMVVRGTGSTVSGKPDIVARKPQEILISDRKTGRQSGKDRWQVRTYIVLFPFCQPVGPGTNLYGEVVYNDDIKLIEVTTDAKRRVLEQIRVTGGPDEPDKTPSGKECSRCDVPNCDERDETFLQGSAQGAF